MPNTTAIALSTHPPKSANARLAVWLKKLPQHTLSIHTATAQQVMGLVQDEQCDSSQLAKLIKQDPILCLALFDAAQASLKERAGDIQHLVHLLGLIGLNKTEHIVLHASQKTKQAHGLNEVLSASLFAAHLANELLSPKFQSAKERFFLPTLFFNAPLWLMWQAAPKTMGQAQHLLSQEQQAYTPLSMKLLGFSLPQLLARTNEFINIPALTQQALAINPADNKTFWATALHSNTQQLSLWLKQDKTRWHFFNAIEMGIYLTNQYALAIYFDWHGKHIKRYEKLLCHYLHIDEQSLKQRVVNVALSVTLPAQFSKSLLPTHRLKGLHREVNTPPIAVVKATNNWAQLISQSENTDSALSATLDALRQSLTLEHCVLMQVNEQKIYTSHCSGFNDRAAMHAFFYPRKNDNNLFEQLLKKPASISLLAEDLSKASQKIPHLFTQCCQLKPCSLLSIFGHGKPQILIYCDHEQWNAQQHRALKAIGKNLSERLNHS